MNLVDWSNIQTLPPKSYICGYCDEKISSEKGYIGNIKQLGLQCYIYICHTCLQATFFNFKDKQTPQAKVGSKVEGIGEESVGKLYDEARRAAGSGAPTATAMACRVILMHVAVAKGAEKGLKFKQYVNFLNTEGYVPKGLEKWAEIIREMGNDANHEIEIMTDEQAKSILKFTETLLKIIYEMPEEIRASQSSIKPKLEIEKSATA